jgi:hypothetical protein
MLQHTRVVVEAWKDAPRTTSGIRVDGESSGERFRTVLESLDAQELVAERLLRRRRGAPSKKTADER